MQIHTFRIQKSRKLLIYKSLRLKKRNAADRNRTGTGITTHGILSPGRLPVPPLRHNNLFSYQWDLQGSNL